MVVTCPPGWSTPQAQTQPYVFISRLSRRTPYMGHFLHLFFLCWSVFGLVCFCIVFDSQLYLTHHRLSQRTPYLIQFFMHQTFHGTALTYQARPRPEPNLSAVNQSAISSKSANQRSSFASIQFVLLELAKRTYTHRYLAEFHAQFFLKFLKSKTTSDYQRLHTEQLNRN